jgi:hypothetical protein
MGYIEQAASGPMERQSSASRINAIEPLPRREDAGSLMILAGGLAFGLAIMVYTVSSV